MATLLQAPHWMDIQSDKISKNIKKLLKETRMYDAPRKQHENIREQQKMRMDVNRYDKSPTIVKDIEKRTDKNKQYLCLNIFPFNKELMLLPPAIC